MITITNPLRIGDVQRYYVRSGEPVCDVSTSEGGYYIAVPVRCYGQGSLFPLKLHLIHILRCRRIKREKYR